MYSSRGNHGYVTRIDVFFAKKFLQKFQKNFAACQFACLFAHAKSHSKGEGGEGEWLSQLTLPLTEYQNLIVLRGGPPIDFKEGVIFNPK